jgi:hypothetical protein
MTGFYPPEPKQPSEGGSRRRGRWNILSRKKDEPEQVSLDDRKSHYKRFIRSLRDDLPGKDEAETYVSVLEKDRDNLESKNRAYIKFRSSVQSTLAKILPPIFERSEFSSRPHDSDDEDSSKDKERESPKIRVRSPEASFEEFLDMYYATREERDVLQSKLENARREIQSVKKDLRNEIDFAQGLRMSHRDEMKELESRNMKKIEALEIEHSNRMDQEMFERKAEREAARTKYDGKVNDMSLEYQKLQSHFLDGSDDFQPRPDESFNEDMKELKLKIQGIAQRDERNRAQLVGKFGVDQDFIDGPGRKAREKVFVLEKVIWDIICKEMFQTPFQLFGEYGEKMLNTVWNDICSGSKSHDDELVDAANIFQIRKSTKLKSGQSLLQRLKSSAIL